LFGVWDLGREKGEKGERMWERERGREGERENRERERDREKGNIKMEMEREDVMKNVRQTDDGSCCS